MKATQVSIGPTQASVSKGRATLVPEMLAAVGARYSRSNLGLEAILEKVSLQDQDSSIDAIFRFIDFGHASVADMVPVAIFLDGVTMWLAYHLWSLCPTAGGQESSTRYIRLSADNLPDPNDLGIPLESQTEWRDAMNEALSAYERAIEFWESVAAKNPEVTRIPASLLSDDSERAQKAVSRMKRNYAFDRARYFLPAALKTNVMLVQSARAWVGLCQQLLSHPLAEPRKLGELIREELSLVAPRLIKHAQCKEYFQEAQKKEWLNFSINASEIKVETDAAQTQSLPTLQVFSNPDAEESFVEDLMFHSNRYGHIGTELQMTPVRFSWGRIAFGDARDLNRHRTGSKSTKFYPHSFYGATDQSDEPEVAELGKVGAKINFQAFQQIGEVPTFLYWTLLGSQFSFQHTTTADKFIYEAELRTGVGAHYRYAKHLHDVLELWYQKFPMTRGLILEGSAEPE